MSREDIVAVASRLFALYLLFLILGAIPALARVPADGVPAGAWILVAVGFALMLALASLCWFFPITIARKLLPVMREQRSEETLGAPVAWSLAVTLLGLWLFAGALVDTVYWVVLVARISSVGEEGMSQILLRPDQVASAASSVAKLVLALVLILGANGLRSLLFRLRHGNGQRAFTEPSAA